MIRCNLLQPNPVMPDQFTGTESGDTTDKTKGIINTTSNIIRTGRQPATSATMKTTDIDILRASINNETAQINWSELQRFFAGGWLIYVSEDTNLLDVAVAFTIDDKDQVSRWLTTGEVAKVSDEQARSWHRDNTTFWSTVVKPWVLIQPTNTDNKDRSQQVTQ